MDDKTRADVQNIDPSYDEAREIVYGMTYDQWKRDHQEPATDEQKRLYEETMPLHAKISGHT